MANNSRVYRFVLVINNFIVQVSYIIAWHPMCTIFEWFHTELSNERITGLCIITGNNILFRVACVRLHDTCISSNQPTWPSRNIYKKKTYSKFITLYFKAVFTVPDDTSVSPLKTTDWTLLQGLIPLCISLKSKRTNTIFVKGNALYNNPLWQLRPFRIILHNINAYVGLNSTKESFPSS